MPGWLLVALLVLLPAALLALWLLKADADLPLLLLGKAPPNAFTDKVVWITGASQGLGELLSLRLASAGARLILSSRSREALEAVKTRCKGKYAPEGVVVLPLDLCAGGDAMAAAAKAALESTQGAGIDYLFHNAGASQRMLVEETNPQVVRDMFSLNTIGPMDLTLAVLPSMLERQKGHFVVVSSASGKVPVPVQGTYAATKHALHGFFNTLAAEVADRGVGVTLICPGPVSTGLDGKPRRLFEMPGARPPAASSSHMSLDRCADLMLAAAAHKVPEAWIAKQPVLLFMYAFQYLPAAGFALMRKIGPMRVGKYKSGSSNLYSGLLSGLLKSKRQ